MFLAEEVIEDEYFDGLKGYQCEDGTICIYFEDHPSGIVDYNDEHIYPESGYFIEQREFWADELIAGQEEYEKARADKYYDLITEGVEFPPIDVVLYIDSDYGEQYFIVDGHHRAVAYAAHGLQVRADVYAHCPEDTEEGDGWY